MSIQREIRTLLLQGPARIEYIRKNLLHAFASDAIDCAVGVLRREGKTVTWQGWLALKKDERALQRIRLAEMNIIAKKEKIEPSPNPGDLMNNINTMIVVAELSSRSLRELATNNDKFDKLDNIARDMMEIRNLLIDIKKHIKEGG